MEFWEFMEHPLTFPALPLSNTPMKLAKGLCLHFTSHPPMEEQHLHPGAILQHPKVVQSQEPECCCAPVLHTQRENASLAQLLTHSSSCWQQAVFLSALCFLLQSSLSTGPFQESRFTAKSPGQAVLLCFVVLFLFWGGGRFHSFQLLPVLSPYIISFSFNRRVFYKWHPVRHILPVSKTWLEMSETRLGTLTVPVVHHCVTYCTEIYDRKQQWCCMFHSLHVGWVVLLLIFLSLLM